MKSTYEKYGKNIKLISSYKKNRIIMYNFDHLRAARNRMDYNTILKRTSSI